MSVSPHYLCKTQHRLFDSTLPYGPVGHGVGGILDRSRRLRAVAVKIIKLFQNEFREISNFSAEISISKVKVTKMLIKGNSNILVKNLKIHPIYKFCNFP